MAFYLSMGLCALGLAGVALTIAWPIKLQPDPFADPFGDVPHLGDWL